MHFEAPHCAPLFVLSIATSLHTYGLVYFDCLRSSEPIREVLESDESDVIPYWALDWRRSAPCGHPRTSPRCEPQRPALSERFDRRRVVYCRTNDSAGETWRTQTVGERAGGLERDFL